MTKILLFTLAWAGLAFAAPAIKLQTSCRVTLTGAQEKPVELVVKSPAFDESIKGFSGSEVSIDLSPYTLTASVWMNQPQGSSSMEPTFQMDLYEGNPMQGQINEVRVQGLDFVNRPPEKPLSLYGLRFLNFDYQGIKISRIDYSCALTKLP